MAVHISVLLDECINALNIDPDGIYVDGTLGLGGHSSEIVKRLNKGKLIGVDRDESAIERSFERLKDYKDKIELVHGNFSEIPSILERLNVDRVNGVLLDLGVSSPQLDEAERGFSYMQEAPLDMRMNKQESLSAWNVVNEWPQERLERILWDYGEERYSRRIVASIIKSRETNPIETTTQLVEVIKSAMPGQALREKQHPAKRTFQAIRIAVNDELGEVEEAMSSIPDVLTIGGRLAVISFHSLEDRIVKSSIARRENGCTCPREAPICTCGFVRTLKSVSRKPILPSQEELENNPRSRSAKLRVAERV